MVEVATLLVTSVNAAVNVLSSRASSQAGKSRKLTKNVPMTRDNPDTCTPTNSQPSCVSHSRDIVS